MKKLLLVFLIAILYLPHSLFSQEVPPLDWAEINRTKSFKATEVWEPVPAKVTPSPAYSVPPPSDAIVLFDGSDLSAWQTPKYGYGARMDNVEDIIRVKKEYPSFSDALWVVKDGYMEARFWSD